MGTTGRAVMNSPAGEEGEAKTVGSYLDSGHFLCVRFSRHEDAFCKAGEGLSLY